MTDHLQSPPSEDAVKSEVKGADLGETQELRLLIDNNQVGGIIGKAGANVTRVREQTGIFLSILKAEVNATERVMVLKGQYEQLVEALKMVAELLIEADAKLKKIEMPEGQTKVRLLVHRGAVGAVIGKGGSVIKETQHETGARVQVSHEALPQSTEKTVTIFGTPSGIHQASMRVLSQLRENPLRSNTKSYPYVPGSAFPFAQSAAVSPFADASIAPVQTNTQKIALPVQCAGCVIGKGGVVIRDLRKESGTNISIADAEPGAVERVVTLTGTAQGIQQAIFLITKLVEAYQG